MTFLPATKQLSWEEFEKKFRFGMGRDMTVEERRWFQLSGLVLDDKLDDESGEEELEEDRRAS